MALAQITLFLPFLTLWSKIQKKTDFHYKLGFWWTKFCKYEYVLNIQHLQFSNLDCIIMLIFLRYKTGFSYLVTMGRQENIEYFSQC